jgi:NodT family efflux transporter outer membrane factor (OMF) lipoprotein
MRAKALLLAGALLALTGCDMAPDYKPPVVTVPDGFKEAGPWQPAAPSDQVARGEWWRVFGDSTLDGLETSLDAGSPTLAAAVARYDEARAFAAKAGSGLYPEVDAGGSSTINRQSARRPLRGTGQTNQYGNNEIDVQATYELDLWGAVRNRVAAGEDLAQASEADLAAVKLSLSAELAADYLTLRGLDNDARLLGDTVAAYQKARDLTQTLFQGSVASGMDVSRAETQLSLARAQLSDIEGRRALIEHAIAALLGKTPAELSIAPAMPTVALPELPAGVPSQLLQRRPDIAAAERRVAAANAGIGIAKAAFYPTLSLGILGGEESTGATLVGLPDSFWTLGPGVSLPLFTGGRLEAQEDNAYASFRESGAAYRTTVIHAFQEVEDNLALIKWLGTEANDVDSGVKQSQRTLSIAMKLYQEGAASYLEVVTAQTTYLQTQLTSIDLRTRRLQADVGLIRALGGSWG